MSRSKEILCLCLGSSLRLSNGRNPRRLIWGEVTVLLVFKILLNLKYNDFDFSKSFMYVQFFPSNDYLNVLK